VRPEFKPQYYKKKKKERKKNRNDQKKKLAYLLFFTCFVETGPYYVAQAGLKLTILSPLPKCYDYRHMPPHPALKKKKI
jgi:hypothetical protein